MQKKEKCFSLAILSLAIMQAQQCFDERIMEYPTFFKNCIIYLKHYQMEIRAFGRIKKLAEKKKKN